MTVEEVRIKLTEIIRDILDDETIILSRETAAKDLDGLDSLAYISIIVAVENEFKIKFDFVDIKRLINIGEMIDLVVAKVF